MQTTIDKAGRVVIPKAIREQVGLIGEGTVDIVVDGTAIRIEPIADAELVERDGIWVVPAGGVELTPDLVDELRRGSQR